MTLSFIIPAFNEEKEIGTCIKSIRNQTHPPLEIIVVDNNSSDNTYKTAKDRGCVVIKEKEQGISAARNAGAKIAKGDFLCFVDADNVLDRNWAKEAVKTLEEPKIIAVSGLNIFRGKTMLGKIKFNLYTLIVYLGNILSSKILGKTYLAGNNFVIEKRTFEEIGGFEPYLAEDIWFSRKFWKHKGKKARINLKMKIYLSARGFEEAGYIRTLSVWTKSFFIKIPQAGYTYKTKPKILKNYPPILSP